MVAWPALLLSAGERVHWVARGLFAGGAVLLADVALLSLSRGSLYSTPLMLVLVFALLPGRLRTFVVLVPVAAGVGLTAPAVLRVGDRLKHGGEREGGDAHGDARAAARGGCRGRDRRGRGAARTPRRALAAGRAQSAPRRGRRRGGDARGNRSPAASSPRAIRSNASSHAWDTFKGGYAADRASGSRLTSGLGSDRYDFYRVALDEFTAHPLVGIGADNFQQQYLAARSRARDAALSRTASSCARSRRRASSERCSP